MRSRTDEVRESVRERVERLNAESSPAMTIAEERDGDETWLQQHPSGFALPKFREQRLPGESRDAELYLEYAPERIAELIGTFSDPEVSTFLAALDAWWEQTTVNVLMAFEPATMRELFAAERDWQYAVMVWVAHRAGIPIEEFLT